MKAEGDLKKFLLCLSMLEEKVATVYGYVTKSINKRVIKCLPLFIAHDSLKHARIFKAILKVCGIHYITYP